MNHSESEKEDVTGRKVFMDLCTAGSLDMPFILDLYQNSFPENERKPFSVIERKAAMGSMEILVIRDGKKRMGFAIIALGEGLVLLDYFAVAEKYRGQGIGEEALQLLRALYSENQFYLEIEHVDDTAPNYTQRLRRKNFYLRSGMQDTGIRVQMFGVDMELLAFEPGLNFEKCEKLYRELMGPMYSKFVKRLK